MLGVGVDRREALVTYTAGSPSTSPITAFSPTVAVDKSTTTGSTVLVAVGVVAVVAEPLSVGVASGVDETSAAVVDSEPSVAVTVSSLVTGVTMGSEVIPSVAVGVSMGTLSIEETRLGSVTTSELGGMYVAVSLGSTAGGCTVSFAGGCSSGGAIVWLRLPVMARERNSARVKNMAGQ
jgi:hypothetical protein